MGLWHHPALDRPRPTRAEAEAEIARVARARIAAQRCADASAPVEDYPFVAGRPLTRAERDARLTLPWDGAAGCAPAGPLPPPGG